MKDESGRALFLRNGLAAILIAIILTLPFGFTDANYFGDKGFLDRFGGFSAVLTGFYIAALVGIASFAPSIGDLDEQIEVGKITRIDDDGESENLTRRQYVCSMFGYLSFVSLFISVFAIFSAIFSSFHVIDIIFNVAGFRINFSFVIYLLAIFFINLIISHMVVTTCHGLYYLIDRLYAKKPKLLLRE
ncbi:MAG: hypothetical protein EOR81_32295 [Mesorhizobium sp.]|nr:MAG: hypothetical protein EOR81_32295 [Mesorhizobium sp.]